MINRDTGLREFASETFIMDPAVNGPANPTIAGWVMGTKYLLPAVRLSQFQPRPVRQIMVYDSTQQTWNDLARGYGVATKAQYGALVITLVEPSGREILKQMPLSAFVNNAAVNGRVIQWPRYFAKGVIPDPRQSYVESVIANNGFLAVIQFIYA